MLLEHADHAIQYGRPPSGITGDSSLCFRPLANQVTAGMDLVWKKYQVFSKAAEKFLEAVREQMESWDT